MRAFLLVLDGVGIGALPDAHRFGDAGAHTLRHVAESAGGLRLPHLESLGLGRLDALAGVRALQSPRGAFGRLRPMTHILTAPSNCYDPKDPRQTR